MLDEQFKSFMIRKVKELEATIAAQQKRIEELEAVAHRKTLAEAVKEHAQVTMLHASDAVLQEKREMGRMIWSRRRK